MATQVVCFVSSARSVEIRFCITVGTRSVAEQRVLQVPGCESANLRWRGRTRSARGCSCGRRRARRRFVRRSYCGRLRSRGCENSLAVAFQVAIQAGSADAEDLRRAQPVTLAHFEHALDVNLADLVER